MSKKRKYIVREIEEAKVVLEPLDQNKKRKKNPTSLGEPYLLAVPKNKFDKLVVGKIVSLTVE